MSEAGPASSPRACSGDRYAAVPSTEPTCVIRVCSAAFAMPKSASLSVPGLGRDEQVARLHVAVHDARAVRVVEPVAGVDHVAHGLLDAELLLLADQVGAGGPLDELHDDVVALGVLVLAGVEDLDDVGVLELGGRERLAPEARDEGLVLGQVLGEQLHRDAALEHRVEREEHGGHAAGAEPAVEPVAAVDFGRSGHQSLAPFFSWPGGRAFGSNWAPPSLSSGSVVVGGGVVVVGAGVVGSGVVGSVGRRLRHGLGDRRLGGGLRRRLDLLLALLADQVAEVVDAVAERVLDVGADAFVVERVDGGARPVHRRLRVGALVLLDVLLHRVELALEGLRPCPA